MPVTLEQHESHSIIRFDGECNVTSAAETKRLLLEGFASRKDVHLDLERVGEIDITIMQLLWTAECHAKDTGSKMVTRLSKVAGDAVRDIGFARFPGLIVEE